MPRRHLLPSLIDLIRLLLLIFSNACSGEFVVRIEKMFSYRSSFYVLFYCTVAACGFLFLLYQKLIRSDRYLKVSLLSFLIFKSGFIYFRVIIIVDKRFSGLTCWTQPLSAACRILKFLSKLPYTCGIRKIALRLGHNSKITDSLPSREAVIY